MRSFGVTQTVRNRALAELKLIKELKLINKESPDRV